MDLSLGGYFQELYADVDVKFAVGGKTKIFLGRNMRFDVKIQCILKTATQTASKAIRNQNEWSTVPSFVVNTFKLLQCEEK